MAPVEPAGVPRQPAGSVHRLRLPDGGVLPDRPRAAHTGLGGRAAVDVAADRGGLPGPGAAGRGAGHRKPGHPAAGGGRVRAVADVHDPGRLLLRRRAAGAAGALGRPAAGPHRAGPHGGGAVRPRRGLHGRHQRGLHPRRACAARNVRADPAGPPPLGAGGLVGAGGRAGHGLVGGAAAVPGPLRVQLPALHRAVRHHHPNHVRGGGAARQRQLGRVPELRAAVADRRIGADGIGVGGRGRDGGRRRRPGRAGPPRPA